MPWHSESHTWRTGPWSLSLRGDEFADIAFDGRTMLRSIRAVVRDQDWNTAPLIVDRVRETDATLMLHVRSDARGSSFRGVVRVEARSDRLDVLCDLESEREFETNRAGLVVLHPPGVAGAPLRVTHASGSVEETAYPLDISPHQPVLDIVGLRWLDDGIEAALTFAGEVFEMEDQRNWTDASFKTYSRPLSLPFPYVVDAGERVRQTVSVHANRIGDQTTTDAAPDRIVLAPGGAFPSIGLGAATAADPAPPVVPIGSSVLVELDLASPNWPAALDRARTAGLPLDVRLILDPDSPEALGRGVAALDGMGVLRVAAYHRVGDARHVSDRETVHALRDAVVVAGLSIPVVGGSRSHFTELNRELHRIPDDLDGLTVTVTPLFHALGTEQLIESVAMQRLVARQTVSYARGTPVHIGPVCLRPRFNDVVTGPQPGPRSTDLCDGYGSEFTGAVDERQSAPELAAWTIASAAALAVPGVASLAWFEEWGARGIRSPSGDPFPVADAIMALEDLEDRELLWGESPDGLVWAIGAADGEPTTVLAANLSRHERTFSIDTPAGSFTTTVPAASFTRHRLPHPEDTP